MGQLLTAASSLACPHGGSASLSATARTAVDGSAGLLMSDTCTISGCPFQIPIGTGTKPSPCVRVQWVSPAMRCRSGAPLLTSDSVGLCLTAEGIPQGSVLINSTQGKVTGQ